MFKEHRPFEYRPPKPETLEREYEGWIMREMEDYFRELGIDFQYVAFGWKYEKDYHVDEFCSVAGKYFGLQFKRPQRKNAASIKWDLDPTQHAVISECGALWYVLPSFLNRNLRREALHHAFFWHPAVRDGERIFGNASSAAYIHSHNADHANLDEIDQKERLGRDKKTFEAFHAYRWGRFAEGLLSCTIGHIHRVRPPGPRPNNDFSRQVARVVEALPQGDTLVLARMR